MRTERKRSTQLLPARACRSSGPLKNEVGATGELGDPRRYRRGWRRLAADSAGGSGGFERHAVFACPSGLEPWIVDVNLGARWRTRRSFRIEIGDAKQAGCVA